MSSVGNESAELNPLELGFLDKAKPWHLMSHLFPNKVGGRPAWLALKNLPTSDELQCKLCQKPMSFLMQIYAPIDEREDCFHRTLFIFMCLDGECYKEADDARPLAIFRSQLGRGNSYYNFVPPANDFPRKHEIDSQVAKGLVPHASLNSPLCAACGCPGSKICAKCKTVHYCSKEHQIGHWKSGHKEECPEFESKLLPAPSPILNFSASPFLLPEFQVTMGPDPEGSPCGSPEPSQQHQGRGSVMLTPGTGGRPSWDLSPDRDQGKEVALVPDDDSEDIEGLEDVAKKETKGDKLFLRFKKAVASEPDQILRYHRNGEPLWLSPAMLHSTNETLEKLVPLCESCGAKRQFEVQITSQLLNNLKLDRGPKDLAPDWGSLYVFTCSANCPPKEDREYLPEVLLRQDVH